MPEKKPYCEKAFIAIARRFEDAKATELAAKEARIAIEEEVIELVGYKASS